MMWWSVCCTGWADPDSASVLHLVQFYFHGKSADIVTLQQFCIMITIIMPGMGRTRRLAQDSDWPSRKILASHWSTVTCSPDVLDLAHFTRFTLNMSSQFLLNNTNSQGCLAIFRIGMNFRNPWKCFKHPQLKLHISLDFILSSSHACTWSNRSSWTLHMSFDLFRLCDHRYKD